MVLLRFAPSPTGPLHLGGLRMALYNHLYARKNGGKWIVRIEDTDASRSVPGSVDGIQKALLWAGLDYDFGPGKGGPHAPYFQSERLDLYTTYAQKLLATGTAYRCFCSVDRLADTRERLARSGSSLSYDRNCLHLTDEEVMRKVRAGERYVVRINDTLRPSRPLGVDLVFGHLKDGHASLATDQVLLKSDNFPTYHLASVADDHEMGITHVLRGEEWLPSLALHLDLYAHLAIAPPEFAHIPVLLNSNGTKMSKRNGDVQVVDYIRRGWEPQALLNWVALAGWGARREEHDSLDAPDSTHVMTLPEMIEQFDISAMTQRSSSLDTSKLEYINKHHIMNAASSPEGLTSLAERVHGPFKEAFPANPHTSIEHIKKLISVLAGRLTNMEDITTYAPYFFLDPDYSSDEARALLDKIPAGDRPRVLAAVAAELAGGSGDLHGRLTAVRKSLQVPAKVFMMTLRHALTGMKDGPSIVEIIDVLGIERTVERLKT